MQGHPALMRQQSSSLDGGEPGSTARTESERGLGWPSIMGKIATANDNSRVSARIAA